MMKRAGSPRLSVGWLSGLCGVALAASGCAEEVTGPTPKIEAPTEASARPVEPPIACNAQLSTDIIVHGKRFSPIPIDIPKNPRVALPTLTLLGEQDLDGTPRSGAGVQKVTYSGDPDDPENLSLLTWQSQQQMTFTLNQAVELEGGTTGEVPSGIYAVRVENPNTRDVERPGAIAIVPKPTLTQITESLACLAQGSRPLQLSGTTFLEIDGRLPTLVVENAEAGSSATVDAPLPVTGLDGCTEIPVEGLASRYCTTGTLTLGMDAIPVGYWGLTVRNPESAACTTEETVRLRVLPPPVLAQVDPPIACVTDESRDLVLTGTDFLQIDGANPTVTLAGKGAAEGITVVGVDDASCETLPAEGPGAHQVKRCTRLNISVAMGALDPGTPEIVVTNPDPAGCNLTSNVGLLRIVPPPTVTEVVPPLVCVDDGSRTLEVIGTDFLTIGDTDGTAPTLPEVAFAGTAVPAGDVTVAPADCTDLSTDRLTVRQCTKLLITIQQDGLDAGDPAVRVTNPDPAGCSDEKAGLLRVVPGPTVTSAAPPLVCAADSDRTLVFTGTGFLRVGSNLPAVRIVEGTPPTTFAFTTTTLGGCTAVDVNGLTVEECTSLTATLAQGTYPSGHVQVEIENPLPAGCTATSTTVLTLPPALAFAASPTNLCVNSGTHTAVIRGTGFLDVAGTPFAVTVGGTSVTPTAVGGCADLGVDGLAVSSCTEFSLPVDTNALAVGGIEVTVNNPDPSGCGITSQTQLQIVPPPTITSVAPPAVCAEAVTTLTITGTDFVNGATITATRQGGGTPVQADTVTVTSPTQLQATFATGISQPGLYDVTIANAAGCDSTAIGVLTVEPVPFVVFVDPPVLYNDIPVEATIITSGLVANAAKVELVDGSGSATDLPNFRSPQRFNKILAEIPTGLPAGEYAVRVTTAIGCVATLPGAVDITDTLTLTLDGTTPIAPDYVSSTVATAVTITGTGFGDVPRIYLNSNPFVSGTATPLRAVVWTSATQLTAIVPPGVPAGDYDLIVVNPTGEVGVASAAVHVTAAEPPIVTAVAPNSFPGNANSPATILGDSFAGSTVSLRCLAPGATTPTTANAPTPTSVSPTSISVVLPTNGIPFGSACVVRVTNADGAFFDYSAISIKNPAANLAPWRTATSSMVETRRALGLVAGRPTATSRFLYALGGDDGAAASAKTSVEAVPTDVFGNLGAWSLQRNALPAARTLAGSAQIGRFVYLAGGHDGTGPTDSLYRSQVLDPLATPEVTDLDAAIGSATVGLPPGLFQYRISAIFPSTDPSNPGGETLPGEPFPVQMPDNPRGLINLTLSWSQVSGASGYRVYRSPSAGSTGSVELLTEITCGDRVCLCVTDIQCRVEDTGGATTAGQTPLPTGSLGRWHSPPNTALTTAREGLATVAAPNPNAANEWFLYALGGRTTGGAAQSDYEWARVTVAADGSQTVSDWTTGTRSIGVAKGDLSAWVVTNADTSAVTTSQTFVFVGTGYTGVGSPTGEITSGILNTSANDGDLIAAAGGVLDTESNPGTSAACGYGQAGGILYTFGGLGNGGNTLATDSSSAVTPGPTLSNWNSLAGGSILTERAFAHVARESAFFYIAGGTTTGTNAIRSVEQTVQ